MVTDCDDCTVLVITKRLLTLSIAKLSIVVYKAIIRTEEQNVKTVLSG